MKKGITIKVSHDLKTTYRIYGNSSLMEKMKGKIFKVHGIHSDHEGILLAYRENVFTFSKSDLTILSIERKKVKPELFNPDNLI